MKKESETIRQADSCPKELLNKVVWNNFAKVNKELEGNFKQETLIFMLIIIAIWERFLRLQ